MSERFGHKRVSNLAMNGSAATRLTGVVAASLCEAPLFDPATTSAPSGRPQGEGYNSTVIIHMIRG
jgi:hypothetical protein